MPQARIVVDRIEGDVAVVQVGTATVDLPVADLPDGAKEGSVLVFALGAQPDPSSMKGRLDKLQAKSDIGDDFTF